MMVFTALLMLALAAGENGRDDAQPPSELNPQIIGRLAEEEAVWDELRPRLEMSPTEVAVFIERQTGCNYYADSGSKMPKGARRRLRCDRVRADGRALRRKYSGRPEVLKLLSETEKLWPW